MGERDELEAAFRRLWGRPPDAVSRAPGRLEILGNHTDYNEGVVLSCAVEQGTWFAAAASPGRQCRVYDLRHELQADFSLDELTTVVPGDWANYIKGVLCELQRRDVALSAFDAVLTSTLPLAAGMSSSAALEISVVYTLTTLYGLALDEVELARIGQGCENNYIGAKTGLLDQFSSIFGRENTLVYTDFRTLEVAHQPLIDGVEFVVANTGVTHDLTVEYNDRRARCEAAASALGVAALRDVSMAELEARRDDLDLQTWRRACHVVGEIGRVERGRKLLAGGDVSGFGALLTASHISSRENFENSCKELDILVDLASALPACYGARLSGGGFGGISIHLVDSHGAAEYQQRLATAYETRLGKQPTTMRCRIGAGAARYV